MFKKNKKDDGQPQVIKRQNTAQMRKTLLQNTLLSMIIVFPIVIYVSLHISAVKYDNPQMQGLDALQEGFHQAVSHPLNFYPMPEGAMGTAIGWALLVIFAMFLVYTLNRVKQQTNPDAQAPLNQWAEISKISTVLNEPFGKPQKDKFATNYIYGENLYMSYIAKAVKNMNNLVIGEPGTGKSRFFVKPNLLQMNSSYVVTDPSGGALLEVGEALYRFGYDIQILDLESKTQCSTYNPLNNAHTEEQIQIVVSTFMESTDSSEGNSKSDPFWDDSMNAYLGALISLLVDFGDNPDIMDGKVYNKCMANLNDLCRMTRLKENIELWSKDQKYMQEMQAQKRQPSDLSHIFYNITKPENRHLWKDGGKDADGKVIKLEPYCLKKWRDFCVAPDKTADTILVTTSVRLDRFNIPELAALTSSDTMSLETFGTKNDALFITIPTGPSGKTFGFIASILYAQLFDILFHRGNTQMKGTYKAVLPDGTFVKWWDQSYSKAQCEEALAKIKKAKIEPVYDEGFEDDIYYQIVDCDGNFITRRPDKQLANEYVQSLHQATLVPGGGSTKVQNPTHIRMLLDEFATTGKIPAFGDRLNTVRKYNISCDVIVQGISQLKKMYGDHWGEIDVGCYITTFLGGKEQETTEWFSKKIGKIGNTHDNLSVDKQKISHGLGQGEREMMDAAEIAKLPSDQMIVMLTGQFPILDKKYEYTNHPRYKYTTDYADDQHWETKQHFRRTRKQYPTIKHIKLKWTPERSFKIKVHEHVNVEEWCEQLFCDDSILEDKMVEMSDYDVSDAVDVTGDYAVV